MSSQNIPVTEPVSARAAAVPSRPSVFVFIAINALLVNAVSGLLATWFWTMGWLVKEGTGSLLVLQSRFLRFVHYDDSLEPMLIAFNFFKKNPAADIYRQIFFQEHVKFQYPLTSLLPLVVLDKVDAIQLVFSIATWLSVLLVIFYSIKIAQAALTNASADRWTAATIIVAGLSFFPLLNSYVLGQLQTVLAAGFAAALFFWLSGRQQLAGALVGLMVLCKPQWGLILVWFLLRRCWGAFAAGAVCAALGGIASILVFGLEHNLGYLEVLQFITRHGESYYPNQSMNGLLHRLFENGDNLQWTANSFAPFHPVVYWGTSLSTAVILGLALFFPWRQRRGGVDDFACVSLAATIGSPVAWNHHYSITFPIFVWLWYSRYASSNGDRRPLFIALAYVLVSNMWSCFNVLANVSGANVLQSLMFFGGLMLLGLLIRGGQTKIQNTEILTSA